MLYANYEDGGGTEPDSTAPAPHPSGVASSGGPSVETKHPPSSSEYEAPVDRYWDAQDGKIVRQRDPAFCRHGPQGMCDYCMPLEPFDSKYQQEHNIKHISFHALLKQKDVAANKAQGSSWIAPLEEEDYRVKVPCPSGQHPGWPAGICTKCQPSAITLQRQPFRMVDHVEFAHPSLIENMLRFWRSTASQRFGFLLGRYEPYPVVPMGIKAKVEAIHEPPQEGELDGVTLGWPWEQKLEVEKIAAKCGLEILGMIYTDLAAETEKRKREDGQEDPNPVPTGKVLAKRHAKSFFLSGNEVLFAAHMQNMFHYYTRFAEGGRFGSRFVTCVVSGQPGGEIGVEAYQVSLQAEAIARANMVQPSVQPNTMRIATNESAAKSAPPPEDDAEGRALGPIKPYIPEVFFRYKNKYGLDVKESAKPTFPVEYLLVNVTNGFPTAPNPLFESRDFPIENRPGLEDQSAEVLLGRLHQVLGNAELEPLSPDSSADADDGMRRKLVAFLSDWHLLAFVPSTGLLAKEEFDDLIQVAVSHDTHAALNKLLAASGWKTLVTLAREHAPTTSGSGAPLDDDELTPEEIAAIIASTEASHIDTASSSNPAEGSRASPIDVGAHTPSAHRPSQPAARARPRAAEEDAYLYDGANDDVPFGAVSDSDDEAVFEDSHSRTSWDPHQTHVVVDDDNDSDVQMGDATASAPAPASAAPAQPTEVACPTCTVLNPASNDTCFLCGLPMHI